MPGDNVAAFAGFSLIPLHLRFILPPSLLSFRNESRKRGPLRTYVACTRIRERHKMPKRRRNKASKEKLTKQQ